MGASRSLNATDERLVLGFDVGGTTSAAVLGTTSGQVLVRRQWPSEAHLGPKPMIEGLIQAGREMCEAFVQPEAVGVAIGGPLDAEAGLIHQPPNLPGWDAVPLRQILERELHLPVGLEHDAAACALAEAVWGAGRGARRLVYFTAGTGFGAGLVIDGEPYYGAGGRPPEIGHLRLADDGPVAFGRRGSVEALCAASALGRIAAWKLPDRWPSPPDSAEIASLAAGGDPEAAAVVEINAVSVGRVSALVADLLQPDLIVIGSLARYLGEPWLERVREVFRQEALDRAAAGCRLRASALGDRLQDLSALIAGVRALP